MNITVAFSPHPAEALPSAADLMRRHEAVILEEPENPSLLEMLQKKISIEAHLLEMDFEFPRFARRDSIAENRGGQRGRSRIPEPGERGGRDEGKLVNPRANMP